ncbi:MAG: hypothetical protein JO029_11575, partial [Candidatus Eremiobacteraeota bacterium]|nr:hypothetical protein [Candidatus Eremiobacteraeota bacterium]
MRKRFLVLSLLAVLASCGGGGGSMPSVPAGAAAGGPVSGGHTTAKVVFSITVPASRGRKPATVSPSTQSVTIAVNGAAPQAFNIALTAAGCGPGSGGPVSCGFTLNVPVGSDTFEVITWDTPGGAGHPLNVGDSIVTIVANQVNTVPLTLTTWAVANLNDAGAGSLRQILSGVSSGDTIGFAVRGQINIASAPLTTTSSVGFVGPLFGAPVVLDGGGINTILTLGGSTLTVSL